MREGLSAGDRLPGEADCGAPDARVAGAVRAVARISRVLERGAGGLSLAHYRVLAAVAEGHERASRVAELLALGRPAVSASVEALCSKGLLTRAGAAGDQRAVQLSVTPLGLEVLRAADAAMSATLEALATATGHPDKVLDALYILGGALDKAPAYSTGRSSQPAPEVTSPVRNAT